MKKIKLVFIGLLVYWFIGLLPTVVYAKAECVVSSDPSCASAQYNYNTFCDAPVAGGYLCCAGESDCTEYKLNQSSSPSTTTAESSWFAKTIKEFGQSVWLNGDKNTINSDRYFNYSVNSIISSLGAATIGVPGIAQSQNNSAVASLGRGIAYFVSQPAIHTGDYVAYMGQKAGFASDVYAQGAGYRGLTPILPIWVAFRNISYLLTALVLVVIGFMIMLRKKIDAQTVIGVQQALPRIVVTLLLITFSYAIAGLVIDMLYFLVYFAIQLFITFGIYTPDASGNVEVRNILLGRSVLTIGLKDLWTSVTEQASNAIDDLLNGVLGGGVGKVIAFVGGGLGYLIVGVAMIYAMFKLWFSLLMAYIQIILSVVIAPIQLMMGAIPGSDTFGKWLRNLLANAMAFPATAVMFLLGAALMGVTDWDVSPGIGYLDEIQKGNGFLPPFINGMGAGDVSAVAGVIGLGILLMTPKVVDMVKEALQAPEFKYQSAIGEALGFGYNLGVKRPIGVGYGMYEKEKDYEKQAALFGQSRSQAMKGLYGGSSGAAIKAGRVKSFFRGFVTGK